MKVLELMKRNVHVVADIDDALVAARMMRDHDVGFLPVCNEAGCVVGIVTDRDLALRVCAEDLRAVATPVGAVMTHGAISCRPQQTIGHAERLMRRHLVTRILVVDDEARPIGVVSLSDVAQYERPARVGRTLRAVTVRKYAPERP